VALQKTSPWPFVGMSGMACAFFLYAASPVAGVPWWGTTLLLLLWLVLFVLACGWWTRRPKGLVVLAVIAVVLWFAAIIAGVKLFGWGS